MEKNLTRMQEIELKHICKKGFGAYRNPSESLEDMVAKGFLRNEGRRGIFNEVCYTATMDGKSYVSERLSD